jgi:hypothetical protein
VSDAPTLFSVMLAQYGPRAVSLQTTPFLQRPPEREAFVDRFDLCLVELDQRDAEKTGELVRRLRPAIKEGGTILIVIRESQPMQNAQRFGANLGEMFRRLAPTARLEEVRYVPASSLRAWSYRTFARLGTAAHQRPWLGLPALALFALPLAFLTLLLNLFAAAGIRATSQRAASSLHVIVRIANGSRGIPTIRYSLLTIR